MVTTGSEFYNLIDQSVVKMIFFCNFTRVIFRMIFTHIR